MTYITSKEGIAILLIQKRPGNRIRPRIESVVFGPSGAYPTEKEMIEILGKAKAVSEKVGPTGSVSVKLTTQDRAPLKVAEYENGFLVHYCRPYWRSGPGIWG